MDSRPAHWDVINERPSSSDASRRSSCVWMDPQWRFLFISAQRVRAVEREVRSGCVKDTTVAIS